MAKNILFHLLFWPFAANKHPIRYTCHTTHKHTYGWQSQPPPRSCTCLGPRESGKGQETNPAEGAGGGARPPKALNPKLHACTLIMGALASHPWMHPTIPAPSRICFLPPPLYIGPQCAYECGGDCLCPCPWAGIPSSLNIFFLTSPHFPLSSGSPCMCKIGGAPGTSQKI